MGTPQDWAPYASLEAQDAHRVLGDALWQEVVLIDGRRLIMWRASDEQSRDREPRPLLETSVRTILLSSITDQILTTEFEVLDDGTRRLSQVTFRMYTQLLTRSHQKTATEADLYCESFRYSKAVDDGGLAQMERLMQFSRALSRCMRSSPGQLDARQSATTGDGSCSRRTG